MTPAAAPEPVLVVVDEPGPFLVLVVACQRCQAVVSRRRYDVREGAPPVDLDAVLDGTTWNAHVCQGH